METYEAAVTINIDDNHETLKKYSLIITLDSKEDHFEITPTLGTNYYSFSNLVYNRRYKLRVKGDWGYGKGTIREKEILVNEEARAKVTNITQEGRNIMFSYYVIDSFETLENTVVDVNVYSNDELIQSSSPFTRVPPLTEQSKVELKFYYIKQATQERIMILYRLATFNA